VRRSSLALAGRDVDPACVAPGRVLNEQGVELSEEQRTLVREASMSRDRVACVVGAAGAGKTTALRALHDVYRDFPFVGAAPSGRAADELESATGIRSTTMHRLLLDTQREGGLPAGCVLVIDEAGMAETRVLAPLLRLVDEASGKVILVGDPHQLPSVAAGGLYAALCERLGSIDLTENRRQHDLGEKMSLARLRAGDSEPYLAHAAARGRLQIADDPLVAKQRLLEDSDGCACQDRVSG
jgi:ATP-dependent exoDNAse (exonuclease V) alpha subunit